MRKILSVVVIGLLPLVLASHGAFPGGPSAHWKIVDGYRLPDPHATPGVVAGTEAKHVCSVAWGKDVRHVSQAMKGRVCRAYGASACPGPTWELDHLISRELGGADEEKNLWPQPIAQARLKDRLENRLHQEVCDGTLGLSKAQEQIRAHWIEAYKARFGKLP